MLESPEVTFPVHLDRNTYVRYTFGSICGMVSLILFGVLLFAINWIPDKNGSDGFSWLATGIVAAVVIAIFMLWAQKFFSPTLMCASCKRIGYGEDLHQDGTCPMCKSTTFYRIPMMQRIHAYRVRQMQVVPPKIEVPGWKLWRRKGGNPMAFFNLLDDL